MIIKQIYIFIGNKPGRLAEITGIIAENNINMRALSLAETTNSGILRIIVENPDEAGRILKENGLLVKTENVLAVLVENKSGGLADMLKILAENDISLKYMYAFAVPQGKACMVMRIEEDHKAMEILKTAGYEGLNIE